MNNNKEGTSTPTTTTTITLDSILQECPSNSSTCQNCNPEHCIRLNNGILMPRIGFGTYKLKKDQVESSVLSAVKAGYRLIDTAHVYGGMKTEGLIGCAFSQASSKGQPNQPRPFLTTKVWRSFHGYEETSKCLNQSLRRLNVNQVDLVLIHWPGPGYNTMHRKKELIAQNGIQIYFKEGHEQFDALRLQTWKALEDAYLAGKCRSIGVSNFTIQHLEKLLQWEDLRIKPSVNQVELHPYFPQTELCEYCHKHDIVIQAYSSLGGQDFSKKDYTDLGQPPLLHHDVIRSIAMKYDKSPAQILLRWALQHGFAIIPKTKCVERMKDNIHLFDFILSNKEMERLDQLDCGKDGRLTWRRDPMRDLDFD